MADLVSHLDSDDSMFIDAVERRLMGAPRRYKRRDLSTHAGVDADDTRRVWRALGFANSREADVAFTDTDLDALRAVSAMTAAHDLDVDTLLGLARALGRTTDRLAMWQVQLVVDMLAQRDGGPRGGKPLARAAAEEMASLVDDLEPLLLYVWRRNVGVALARLLADAQPETHLGVVRTVGFADLVSFTRLARQLSESDLAALVTRFEAVASDIVSEHGGAVVKTVGDEILFSHQDPEGASRIARALKEMSEVDDLLPQMRVGLSTGRVLARLGDIYGTTVNRAARLTNAAAASQILVDEATADALRHDPESTLRAHEPLELAGIGLSAAWILL
ncbi:adenylate/guanylate cyclase domain-containing protein [Dermacoccus nishinomiyaensis]|uniref:adenylate/guanylate cyclase domain-containing protein n=1 Tax=Dermacoccus nishinomiyaensis TaxID=1274 RepID=UPI0011A53252|nr:adenylate/guanylate cyclase domain-containing protein [Dermacoccus nishinomiyaensis]